MNLDVTAIANQLVTQLESQSVQNKLMAEGVKLLYNKIVEANTKLLEDKSNGSDTVAAVKRKKSASSSK